MTLIDDLNLKQVMAVQLAHPTWYVSGRINSLIVVFIFQKVKLDYRFFDRSVYFTRTETPLHLTDDQFNSTEPTEGHVFSITGPRCEKIGDMLFRGTSLATGGNRKFSKFKIQINYMT